MNIINKKTILFFTVSSLMFNGCAAKTELESKSVKKISTISTKVQNTSLWKKSSSSKINDKDCIDCYATPLNNSKVRLSSNNIIKKVENKVVKNKNKTLNKKNYGAYNYIELASEKTVKGNIYTSRNKYVAPVVSYVNSSYGSYSTNTGTAIQVGAFRKYRGAKAYMKRYSALSNNYKVTIKTGEKNNKPLHRVRIEGFKNKSEAKKFMYTYGIRDAFVVRK